MTALGKSMADAAWELEKMEAALEEAQKDRDLLLSILGITHLELALDRSRAELSPQDYLEKCYRETRNPQVV
jgi:hypothetical protein